MSQLEIILPFGIPPSSMAKALVTQMEVPSLSHLFGSAKTGRVMRFNEFARHLPHEYWQYKDTYKNSLSKSVALELEDDRQNSPPSTIELMQKFGLTPESGYWFTLSPVHIHVARDHLVLTDQRHLFFSEQEARDLFNAAQTICEERGKTLLYGDSKNWFLRADDWQHLKTASLDAASGHNMDIWIAGGEQERAWRQLQNEIQMLWHIHRVNQERETSGERLINSVWLHCGAHADIAHPPAWLTRISFYELLEMMQASPEQTHRICIDDLIESALNSDWGVWLQSFQTLEKNWFAPMHAALNNKKIKEIQFVLSDHQSLVPLTFCAKSPWQFWRKPSLAPLLKTPL